MKPRITKNIYTFGHSVQSIEAFIGFLQYFNIQLLADVRRYPASKRHPQYNKHALANALKEAGIQYLHFPDLGGKLDVGLGSYEDHMQTEVFKAAITHLQDVALGQTVAYMCAEADWENCHRAKLSDYLAKKGWNIFHIKGNQATPHPTEKAVQGRLF